MRLSCLLVLLAGLCTASLWAADANDPNWWRHAVIYEVYPRSFADSNGDGIGDLNGITEHLDYLKDLGIDAIWITPFYPSPQVDFGYDISNYEGIDPQFGTMADFERLTREANQRGIRVIADFVVNHTSDQHPWFLESESSRTNAKADWYIWHDGKPGGTPPNNPPNNWLSIFGHSGWQWVPQRSQYYYHAFYRQQPDLNWRNDHVRNAMYDVERFWIGKGVSGFRLDAVTSLFEDIALKDQPYLTGKDAYGDRNESRVYTDNLPEVHDVLRGLRKVANEKSGTILIGETYLNTINDLAKMYGKNGDELQLPMDTQFGFGDNKLSVPFFRQKLQDAETGLNGNMPLFVFENHDNPRSLNRYGDGAHDAQIARLLATLLLTPRDVALMYYGEELGMVNHDPKRKEDVQDPIGKLGWPKEKGRDGERTPMQWNSGKDAGFSNADKPWLPIGSDYKTVNVASEEKRSDSLLNYYKKLIQLRRQNAQLRDGAFALADASNDKVLSFVRSTSDGKKVLVALNMSPDTQTLRYTVGKSGRVLVASFDTKQPTIDLDSVSLPGYGSLILQVR